MKTLFAISLLYVFTSVATAQISIEEAQRRLDAKQTSKPATIPSTKPIVQSPVPDLDLFQQALIQFQAGNYKEAIATVTSFQATLRRPVGKLTDPNWIDSLHLQAVAHMKLGQHARAVDIMERVFNSGQINRSIVVNFAVADIVQKQTAMRAVKNLKAYNASHSEDELIVNLWGVALDTAATRNQAGRLDAEADDFLKANSVLEYTKSGMKHWGTQWMTAQSFAPIERQRAVVMENVDHALASLTRAEDNLRDAKARHAKANTLTATFGRSGTTDRRYVAGVTEQDRRRMADEQDRRNLESASQEVSNAQRNVANAEQAVTSARSKLPKPDWSMKLEPIDPEPIQNYSKLAQDLTAARIADWEKQQAQLPAENRPFEVKGARVGMPLEMFKLKFHRAGPGERHPAPFSSDENPQRDNPTLLYKAILQKAGIVHASTTSPDDQDPNSPNRPTIAGVPARNFIYQFVDGKLYQVTIHFDRENLPQVTEALKTKYGNPSSTKFKKYDNNVGLRFDGQATIWSNSVSEINLFEYAGDRTRSLLLIVHNDLQKVAEDRIKQPVKPRADDL